MSKILSIYCDESGDFGPCSKHSPYYLVTFIQHDPLKNFDEEVKKLKNSINYAGYDIELPIHTYPLIRNERESKTLSIFQRRKILSSFWIFINKIPIQTKTIIVDKRNLKAQQDLPKALEKKLIEFISGNSIFRKYDEVKIYYDNGQRMLTDILLKSFNKCFIKAKLSIVKQNQCLLLQVADSVCAFELINLKINNLSKSEKLFFQNKRKLNRKYLNILYKKRIE